MLSAPAGMRLPVSLIAACSLNRVIGTKGKLPWTLPADWAFFCAATKDQVLLVGRNSFQEFDGPVPGRHTIVVSSTLMESQWSGVRVARSLQQALELASTEPQYANCNRVFVGGGERLYEEAMATGVADSCYVTRVQRVIEDGDRFFPQWTTLFPELLYSAKTNGGDGTRVSFEIWGTERHSKST